MLTPQTRAVNCEKAIKILKEEGLLFRGCSKSVSRRLKGLVRFHNNKAGYIVGARKAIDEIHDAIRNADNKEAREWIVKNVKGIGYKEASHFLRNVGLGKDIAIIDRHILKNLKKHGALKEIPKSINRKSYLELEKGMKSLAGKAGIPMEELDLLFWSKETGFIFK